MFKSIVLWSYFDYCSKVWGSCGEGMRNRLQTLQNRAARVVTSSSYDRRSAEILDELGWDNFQTRRTGQFATIMYKLKNHIAPDHVAQIFNSTIPMYTYNVRNSKYNLFVPRLNTETEKKNSFHYRRAVLRNSPSNAVKGHTSLKLFLSHL